MIGRGVAVAWSQGDDDRRLTRAGWGDARLGGLSARGRELQRQGALGDRSPVDAPREVAKREPAGTEATRAERV